MSDFEKAKKNLKNDMLVLSILELIIIIYSIISGNINYFSFIFAALLFSGFILSKNGSKSAGTVGIVVGIWMMLTLLLGDIIDFLLGLFVVIHSSKYIKLFN